MPLPEENAAPAGGGEEVSSPAGEQPSILDREHNEAMEALAGETTKAQSEQAPQPEDDDPEVNLRDNTKVKLSELKKHYRPQWEKEYQTFAQRQQAFQQQIAGFNQQQQATAQLLQQAVNFVSSRMPQAPGADLLEKDPFEYQRQKLVYDTEQQKLHQLRVQQNAFMQQSQVQQQRAFANHLMQQKNQLLGIMPDLKDPVKATKFYEETKDYLASKRFNQKEIAGIYDHRILEVLQDALEGRRLRAQLEKAQAKLKAAREEKPPVQVQEPRRRRTAAEVQATSLREDLARLRKTGSVWDAEKVLSRWD